MGFKIGKFVGRVTKGLVKSAPAIISGYAAGGPGGAALATLGSTTYGSSAAQRVAPGQTLTSFAQPSGRFPMTTGAPPYAVQVAQKGVAVRGSFDQELFNLAMKVIDKLGIRVLNPNAVQTIIRRVLAGLIRFARRMPGLSLVAMLIDLGLTAIEANRLITWYATAGKKRRRIRVTNVKALNRSVRRLEGFRRLSHRVEAALAKRGVARGYAIRRRCPRCRKNPCCCG